MKNKLAAINNILGVGELSKTNNSNRVDISRVDSKINLKRACDKIVDNITNSFEPIFKEKNILHKYNAIIKKFLEKDDSFTNFIDILPKEFFEYIVSIIGLTIYHQNNTLSKSEDLILSDYFDSKILFNNNQILDFVFPFDFLEKKNSFNSYLNYWLEKKNIKKIEYENISKWKKNNGTSISVRGLKSLKEALESQDNVFSSKETEEIIATILFKRIQWKLYKKLGDNFGEDFLSLIENFFNQFNNSELNDDTLLEAFEKLILELLPIKRINFFERINFFLKNLDKVEKIYKEILHLKTAFKSKKNFLIKDIFSDFSDKNSLKFFEKYNYLKDHYSLENHKILKKEIENELIKTKKNKKANYIENIFLEYFIEDSYYLLDLKEKQIRTQKEKKEFNSLKKSFEILSQHRCVLNKKFMGEKIYFLDFLLKHLSYENFEPLIFFYLIVNTTPKFKEKIKKLIVSFLKLIFPEYVSDDFVNNIEFKKISLNDFYYIGENYEYKFKQ